MTLLAVAVGGALGAVLRWWLGDLAPGGDGFPWTTLAINVSGCLAIGLLPAVGAVRHRPVLAAALGPGLLGGFTTMSAYAEEVRALLADGRGVTATAYVIVSALACIGAVLMARRLTGKVER